jgi:hypothetical protein
MIVEENALLKILGERIDIVDTRKHAAHDNKKLNDLVQSLRNIRGSNNSNNNSNNSNSNSNKCTGVDCFPKDDVVYVRYDDVGLSVELRDKTVDAIHLYNEHAFRGIGKFLGVVPHGIDFARDTAMDVVNNLGEPDTKGGIGAQIFVQYERIGVKITFNSNDWETPSASIASASIWLPSGE